MKIEIMSWTTEQGGLHYTHECWVDTIEDLREIVQLPLNIKIQCTETGKMTIFGDVRSKIGDTWDFKPSFALLRKLREGLK